MSGGQEYVPAGELRCGGGGGAAGAKPTAPIPAAPAQRTSPPSLTASGKPGAACLRLGPSAPLARAPPRQPGQLENYSLQLQAPGGKLVTARCAMEAAGSDTLSLVQCRSPAGRRACGGLRAGRRSRAGGQQPTQTGSAAAAHGTAWRRVRGAPLTFHSCSLAHCQSPCAVLLVTNELCTGVQRNQCRGRGWPSSAAAPGGRWPHLICRQ